MLRDTHVLCLVFNATPLHKKITFYENVRSGKSNVNVYTLLLVEIF